MENRYALRDRMLRRLPQRFAVAVLTVSVMTSFGCDAVEQTSFEPEIVVEAYLEAGKRLPDIRLGRTVPIDEAYDPEEVDVGPAAVQVRLLDDNGEVEEEYDYRASEVSRGLYFPVTGWSDTPAVKPLRTYELRVEVQGEPEIITSRTLVPDTFFVAAISADTVLYRSDDQLAFDLSPTEYPGRQNVYLFTTVALDAHEDLLTPFAAGLLKDSDLTIEDLRERTAPPLNEANFERLANGFLHVRFPWVGVNFFGRNEILVSAIDTNLHDFVRSQSIQQGGSTLPPGEIPNVLEHVAGGRGIFGSYSRARVLVFVTRPND